MPRPLDFDRPIAHRGLHDRSAGVIENSLSAFSAAVENGFATECDVQLSSDGKPFVFHDDTLERLTGREGPVGSLSANELDKLPLLDSANGDCPPRFETLLEALNGEQLLVVEIKSQPDNASQRGVARAVAGALADYAGPVVVESFDPKLLTLVRAAGYAGPLGIILMRNIGKFGGPKGFFSEQVLRHMLHWPMTRFDFMSVNKTDLDLPMVRFWRAMGRPVTAWTIRSSAEAEGSRSGADQIVFEGFSPERG